MLDFLYRICLLLYPPAFRRRYGHQMREDFREMRVRRTALLPVFTDAVRTAAAEWLGTVATRVTRRSGIRVLQRAGDLVGDVRLAARSLGRRPAFALVVVLTLGIGIGASAAVFSWIEALVLDPLPAVEEVDRLYTITMRDPDVEGDDPVSSYPDLVDLRDALAPSARVAGYGFGQFRTGSTAAADDATERVWGAFVTADYFPVLAVDALLGSVLDPRASAVARSDRVVVISEGLWTRRFGRDAGIVGRTIRVGGSDFDVAGVVPSDFIGTTVGLRLDVWLPVAAAADLRADDTLLDDRERRWLRTFVRLEGPGTRATLEREVNAFREALHTRHAPGRALEIGVEPFDIGVAARLEPLLMILLGLTGFVLLAVCSNVANLALMRGVRKDREVAILRALGAGRGRVAGRVLAESTILGLLGVASGLVLATFGARLLPALLPASPLPLNLQAPMDGRVFAFASALGLTTALVFGAMPAIRASRIAPIGSLRVTAGRQPGTGRTHTTLIVVQLALSLGTLVAAGFFFDRLDQLGEVDPGFVDAEGVLLFPAELPEDEPRKPWEAGTLSAFVEEVRAVAGVRSAAIASFVPLGLDGYAHMEVRVPGRTRSATGVADRYLVNRVSEGYFELMGIPIRSGRAIDTVDRSGSTAAVVVNEAFAREYWPGTDPVGRGFTVNGRDAIVVGVAADGKYRFDRFDEPAEPFLYLAWQQWPSASLTLHVRADGAAAVLPGVRQTFEHHFPDGQLFEPMRLDDYSSLALVPVRLGASVLGALGALAMGLAALGLYAIMALQVSLRTREVGVRMAVGAARSQILGMFMLRGLRTVGTGLAAGIPVAVAIHGAFRSLIPGFDPGWPPVYGAAAGAMLLIGLSAVGMAARRASRVMPSDALRAP